MRIFFNIIGKDLLEVVNEFRREGEALENFNTAFISLIPKDDKPPSFEDFHRVSLCNCVYKVISKILARKLKPFLSRAI